MSGSSQAEFARPASTPSSTYTTPVSITPTTPRFKTVASGVYYLFPAIAKPDDTASNATNSNLGRTTANSSGDTGDGLSKAEHEAAVTLFRATYDQGFSADIIVHEKTSVAKRTAVFIQQELASRYVVARIMNWTPAPATGDTPIYHLVANKCKQECFLTFVRLHFDIKNAVCHIEI